MNMEDNQALFSFTTRSFTANPKATILLATFSGLGFMWLSFLFSAPIIISMIFLILGILLVYGIKVGSVTYELHNEGIRQLFTSWIGAKRKRKSKVREIFWSDIESYSNDVDMQRSMKEYEYLKLYLNKSPREVWITDQHNKPGFAQFKEVFIGLIEGRNNTLRDSQTEDNVPGRVQTGSVYMQDAYKIPKRKSFYHTNFVKILTVLFVFICGGIFYWAYTYGMKGSNWFRLTIIIIPGTLYLIYRVFIKDKNN